MDFEFKIKFGSREIGFSIKPEENTEQQSETQLDWLIEEWAPDIRDSMIEKGYLDDDFRGMHRTALISIARVRQSRAAAEDGHQQFSQE